MSGRQGFGAGAGSIGRRQYVQFAVFYHAVTPVACHPFFGNVFTVDEWSASGQKCGRGFGMTMMALACFHSRGTRGRVFVATHTGSIVRRDAASDVIEAARGLRRNTVTADTSNSGRGARFTGCLEVAGEARVRVHRKMTFGVDGGVATGALQLRTAGDRAQVFRVVEEVGLPDVQGLCQSLDGVAAAAEASCVVDLRNRPVRLGVSDRGNQLRCSSKFGFHVATHAGLIVAGSTTDVGARVR